VNIQKTDEFASHELNRDTWKHGSVKLIVTSHFLFWQQQWNSPPGVQYLSLYQSVELPLVDIVDPITGALLERISGSASPPPPVHPAPCTLALRRSINPATEGRFSA
jgi:hypothetical protein